ncbi:hypothetical protein BY996DRAFT_6512159 [Phakopsora pachyrhizi]|nr:hypothetical protein BY996DRAFT_6512159 [Phakopsora pachyrhizi]
MYRLYGSEMISCGLERPERLEEMGMRAKYPIVLGRMEEISAEAKLLIGLCYEICFLVKELRRLVATVCGLRELLRFVYHLAGFRLCWLRRMNKADLVIDGRSEAVERETDETDDRMGGGAGSGEWMAELRIQKAAIRDWRPADQVKVWSCLQKLAEEEGEENHRLDNPFNICSSCSWGSINCESIGQGGREVAVVVHAVFLFKVLRLKVFDLVGWVEVIAENLKIIGSLRQIGSNFLERSESLAVGMVTVTSPNPNLISQSDNSTINNPQHQTLVLIRG